MFLSKRFSEAKPGKKTEVINVSKALQTHPKKNILGDQEITRVQSIKHLGITYQENGNINIEERLSLDF
jgi:hypothetical protein